MSNENLNQTETIAWLEDHKERILKGDTSIVIDLAEEAEPKVQKFFDILLNANPEILLKRFSICTTLVEVVQFMVSHHIELRFDYSRSTQKYIEGIWDILFDLAKDVIHCDDEYIVLLSGKIECLDKLFNLNHLWIVFEKFESIYHMVNAIYTADSSRIHEINKSFGTFAMYITNDPEMRKESNESKKVDIFICLLNGYIEIRPRLFRFLGYRVIHKNPA